MPDHLQLFHRPAKELYVRVTVELGGWTFEPAVEFYGGDSFDELALMLESTTLAVGHIINDAYTPMDRAEMICKVLERHYPGRGHFCEVWQHGRRGFAQSVQPVGFPINR